jgi:hypothetical protein
LEKAHRAQVRAGQAAHGSEALGSNSEVDRFGVQFRQRLLVEGKTAHRPLDFRHSGNYLSAVFDKLKVEAGLAILQGSAGGFWVHTEDTHQPDFDPGNVHVFESIREVLAEERYDEYRRTWWN